MDHEMEIHQRKMPVGQKLRCWWCDGWNAFSLVVVVVVAAVAAPWQYDRPPRRWVRLLQRMDLYVYGAMMMVDDEAAVDAE